MDRIGLAGRTLVSSTWGPGKAEIVLLHDGLGSIAQWRHVPAALHAATGRTVLAYDRSGHGSSLPVPSDAWPTDWLHREAGILCELIDGWAANEPLLVGHSDGGSIALLAAASGQPLRGIVTLAAHSYVEQVCVDRIAAMRTESRDLVGRLGRVHDHPAAVFEAWSAVWTSGDFRSWDIRELLDTVSCPALIVQGIDDEYGTPEQAWSTAAAIGENATCTLLPGVGHLLHHEAPERVVGIIAERDRMWR